MPNLMHRNFKRVGPEWTSASSVEPQSGRKDGGTRLSRPTINSCRLWRPNSNNPNLNNAGQKGITLVEIVVATFILILTLSALLLLFSRTKHNAEAARRHLNALQVVRTELEQLRSTSYSNITSYAATNLTNTFFVPLEGRKQRSVLETNGFKEISMIISWKSSVAAQTASQTFYTIICNTN